MLYLPGTNNLQYAPFSSVYISLSIPIIEMTASCIGMSVAWSVTKPRTPRFTCNNSTGQQKIFGIQSINGFGVIWGR